MNSGGQLLDRDPTPEDLEAERDQPRPGVWAGEEGADLRALTQDETDALIRVELWMAAWPSEDLTGAVGQPRRLAFGEPPNRRPARVQRGGIDSDPLVRVLARRAWGDRDRQWFELRGVRKGDAVAWVLELDLPAGFLGPNPAEVGMFVSMVVDEAELDRASRARRDGGVGCAWPEQDHDGVALDDGRPGEEIRYAPSWSWMSDEVARVSDRLREPPIADRAFHVPGGECSCPAGWPAGERCVSPTW